MDIIRERLSIGDTLASISDVLIRLCLVPYGSSISSEFHNDIIVTIFGTDNSKLSYSGDAIIDTIIRSIQTERGHISNLPVANKTKALLVSNGIIAESFDRMGILSYLNIKDITVKKKADIIEAIVGAFFWHLGSSRLGDIKSWLLSTVYTVDGIDLIDKEYNRFKVEYKPLSHKEANRAYIFVDREKFLRLQNRREILRKQVKYLLNKTPLTEDDTARVKSIAAKITATNYYISYNSTYDTLSNIAKKYDII